MKKGEGWGPLGNRGPNSMIMTWMLKVLLELSPSALVFCHLISHAALQDMGLLYQSYPTLAGKHQSYIPKSFPPC